ncbi:hypothetical protein G9464_13615 [Halostella sp. JP-L12]|uniref:hypothetical protein n=1 Tax=Halostella TaxID=1843185 RepID=UPI000EF85451|nr:MULTISPECIES: hypothetical protein [Halostella]NHN48625.1 hypothetical protein [Halostella sp. JP-L12]
MNDDVLDEQRELVSLLEDAGWDVTEAEVSVYESPWEDDDSPEATVSLTARKLFEEESDDGDGDDDISEFRIG